MKKLFAILILAVLLPLGARAQGGGNWTISQVVSGLTNFPTVNGGDLLWVGALTNDALLTYDGGPAYKAGTITISNLVAALGITTSAPPTGATGNYDLAGGTLFFDAANTDAGLTGLNQTGRRQLYVPLDSGAFFIVGSLDYGATGDFVFSGCVASDAVGANFIFEAVASGSGNLTNMLFRSQSSAPIQLWAGGQNGTGGTVPQLTVATNGVSFGAGIVTAEGDTFYPHTDGSNLVWTTTP